MSEKATFLHIDQWKQLTAQFEDESYYCNTSAYGSSDPGRRGENAETYWDSLTTLPDSMNTLPWIEYCQSTNHTFDDTIEFFIRPTSRPFPHLGSIGAYQLAADLTYSTSVHPMPDCHSIAKWIPMLDKMSTNAILYLTGEKKYNHSNPSTEECESALRMVIQWMTALTTQPLQEFISLDGILAEKAMSTFFIAIDEGLIRSAI
ncbi:hypothetical protein BJ912DRAFT_925121 [Pholiota molesta]|nr:hypothetical protein BJ912DRAFT_925121 [Pholiota molesta]